MRILLINPDNPQGSGRDLYSAELTHKFIRFNPLTRGYFGLPLALTTLAALTPRRHSIRIVDEAVEDIDFDEECDLVGLTAMTFKAKRAYEIAARFRARGIPVVMGGIHASMCPDEVAAHVDTVVVGEADSLWAGILEDAEAGCLKPRYQMTAFPDITTLPPPRYEVAKYKNYVNIYLQTARGCPFHCSFCTVTQMSGRRMRLKTPEQVIAELESVINLKPINPVWMWDRRVKRLRKMVAAVFLVDDNFAINRNHALAVTRALKEYQDRHNIIVIWYTQVNYKVGLDDELLAAMADANCQQLFMGFESLDPATLKAMNKTMNSPESYAESIHNVRRHGMEVIFSTILGGEHDTAASADHLAEFIERHSLLFVLPNILTPYPGTALHRQMTAEGRITDTDTDRYNIRNVVYEPRRMTQGELTDSYVRLITRIFDHNAMRWRGRRLLKEMRRNLVVNPVERLTMVLAFWGMALVLMLMGRITPAVGMRLLFHLPGIFIRYGTIASAWWMFGITADYNDFARSEAGRLRRRMRRTRPERGGTVREHAPQTVPAGNLAAAS